MHAIILSLYLGEIYCGQVWYSLILQWFLKEMFCEMWLRDELKCDDHYFNSSMVLSSIHSKVGIVCLVAFEADQERKLHEQLQLFDKKLEEEAEQEQKKNEKTILALNARKEALLKEKKAKVKQEIDKMSKQGASKEEQEAILKEHSKDLAKLMNKMDADRMRMQSSLEERLKKRREAKRKAKVSFLH